MAVRRKSLELIILAPVLVFLVLAGAGLYFLILNSVEEFADRSIRESFEWMSEGVYSIADRQIDQLNRAGLAADEKATKIHQVSALIEIEDFARKNDIGILVYAPDKQETVLLSGIPEDTSAVVGEGVGQRGAKVTLPGGGTYYSWTFLFTPWSWRITLLKDASAYASLVENARYFYAATGVALILVAVFLIVYLRRAIAWPIHQIVTRFREGNTPEYKGIREFEFLSESIGQMMREIARNRGHLEESKRKLEEYSRTLEQKVEKRTRQLARSVEELKALGEVSQAVSSSLDLQTVLTTIVTRAAELSGSDAGIIYEFDEVTQTFHARATHRIAPEHLEALRAQPTRLGVGAVGHAAATQVPVQVADIRDEQRFAAPKFRQILVKLGIRSMLAIPLFREARLLGGLVVYRREPGNFSDEVVNVLQTFAAQSALAINNARMFQEIQEKGRQLEIASQHKSAFLANMSHELRTPMNAILGYTELILDNIYGEVPEKIGETIERIDNSGRHLLHLINDVLDVSKIEAGQLKLSLHDYSMKNVVDSVIASVESLRAEKGLALRTSIPVDLPVGKGDEQRITQVLLNLLGNAIKFTDQGEISVQVSEADSAFVVSVSDTGVGITEEEQKNIFEEFHQVDDSDTRKKGGTGLGLTITKRIIEMHGGQLRVESKPGEGSTFSFALPVRVEQQTVAA